MGSFKIYGTDPSSALAKQSAFSLLNNPSDKILNFLAIYIRNFPGNNTLSMFSLLLAISAVKLKEKLIQQFHRQQ